MEDSVSELRKVNLVMTYPVRWGERTVMNNFIQNFYDALGPEAFSKDFHSEYRDKVLSLYSEKGFSREWLYYMGATTKNSPHSRQAGGFGEGFKVAALVAVRDFHLEISMSSRDWSMTVTTVEDDIAGSKVQFLAYDIRKRPYEENARLVLGNVEENLFDAMKRELNRFFYEENPLFGEPIVCAKDYVIYRTGSLVSDCKKAGYLFASYMNRKKLDVPLIICHHYYKPDEDDRDRAPFDRYDTAKCIRDVFSFLGPRDALTVLESIRSKWNTARGRNRGDISWERAVYRLVTAISGDPAVRSVFLKKYGETLRETGDGSVSPVH